MLSEVRNLLEAELGSHEDASPEQLEHILSQILNCFNVEEIVSSVVSIEGELEQLANRSYIHENGFCKLILIDPPNKSYRLRLHLWENDSVDPNIHNHRWNYASVIYQGSIKSTLYEECDDGEPHYCYEWGRDVESNSRTAQYKKVVGLCEVSERNIEEGEMYSQHSSDLHKILPTDSYSSSLLLQGPKKDHSVEIYSRHELSKLGRPMPISVGRVLRRLEAFDLT